MAYCHTTVHIIFNAQFHSQVLWFGPVCKGSKAFSKIVNPTIHSIIHDYNAITE